MKKEIDNVKIEKSKVEDAASILHLIASAPDALLAVTHEEILGWIAQEQSLVGRNENGQIIAHQGMAYWEGCNVVEIRSAYVVPEYRGGGLNTKMKHEMIESAKAKYPSAHISGFTESASKSRGVLQKLGFQEIPLEDVPEEMFTPCPATCFKKTGNPCGCKVYFLPEGL
jgi:N-acetylglutamate synthase-like GNAT family acetyltransferase